MYWCGEPSSLSSLRGCGMEGQRYIHRWLNNEYIGKDLQNNQHL